MDSQQPEKKHMEPKLDVSTVHFRSSREMDIIDSDRVDLIQQANRLVECMVNKQTLPKLGGVFSEVDLTNEENQTYQSALGFLRRQFEIGFKETDAVESKREIESTIERET
ncbi:MAG: hypothetical protein R3C03_24060 [Pirellulaceae bacterium]